MGKRKTKKATVESTKVIETVRDWKLGDYIRQLSIVILGIFVTFWGSDLISDYYKQKEIRSAMRLIKIELEENQKELRSARERWNNDCTISLLLVNNDFQYLNIPRDTLLKYMGVLTSTWAYSPTVDALDALKSSGLMQGISDKDLIFKFSQVYQSLRGVEFLMKEFNDMKKQVWTIIDAKGLNSEDEKKFTSGDFVETYRVYLSFYQMRSLIRTIPAYLDTDIFSVVDKAIQETIQVIEVKYK